MACTNCSTKTDSNGVPRGCQSKGTCGTDSCNKLAVFDWLSNMVYPDSDSVFDIVEVRFKNGRKDFYRYPEGVTMTMGDIVATESSPGHDIGIVSLVGELVKVQMKKKKVSLDSEVLKIYRKATQKDIDVWQDVRQKEEPVRMRAREIAIRLNLEMKISDVEFQGDGSKATFYYTASERVDFRQLIKDFAKEFGIRIEMKQVGFRQEAARLGGIGSCGRELCCSTWLTDFRSVNTAAARYQQLSLNPQKLAGQCGKLKCCLNFELDTYLEALKDMPDSDTKLFTVKGIAFCQKIDIFKGQMWFAYANNSANWYVLSTDQVKEILALNAKDEKGCELESYSVEIEDPKDHFQSAVEQDSVTRFDQPKRRRKNNKSKEKKDDRTISSTNRKPLEGNKEKNTQREDRKAKPRVNKVRNEERKEKVASEEIVKKDQKPDTRVDGKRDQREERRNDTRKKVREPKNITTEKQAQNKSVDSRIKESKNDEPKKKEVIEAKEPREQKARSNRNRLKRQKNTDNPNNKDNKPNSEN